jgi:hypothetical protein
LKTLIQNFLHCQIAELCFSHSSGISLCLIRFYIILSRLFAIRKIAILIINIYYSIKYLYDGIYGSNIVGAS